MLTHTHTKRRWDLIIYKQQMFSQKWHCLLNIFFSPHTIFTSILSISATQPQSHAMGGTSQILPSHNPVQNSITHNNAGSPAVFIASGSCTEHNMKVKWKSIFFIRHRPLHFQAHIYTHTHTHKEKMTPISFSLLYASLAIIQLNCTAKNRYERAISRCFKTRPLSACFAVSRV